MTSKRFFELEQRCKRRKKAKMARYIVFIFTFCLSVFGLFYSFFGFSTPKLSERIESPVQMLHQSNVSKSTPVEEVLHEKNSTQEVHVEAEQKQTYDTLFLEPKVMPAKKE